MKVRCKVCGAESEVEDSSKAPKCCGKKMVPAKMAPVKKKTCCR